MLISSSIYKINITGTGRGNPIRCWLEEGQKVDVQPRDIRTFLSCKLCVRISSAIGLIKAINKIRTSYLDVWWSCSGPNQLWWSALGKFTDKTALMSPVKMTQWWRMINVFADDVKSLPQGRATQGSFFPRKCTAHTMLHHVYNDSKEGRPSQN